MKRTRNIYKRAYAIALVMLLCAMFVPGQSYAQCVAGIPCVQNLTPDPDHFDNIVEPNQPASPNSFRTPTDTCDADFMNQITARALLEAERENVLGQVVIRKPDSVLDYSCFEDVINNTGGTLGGIFSDNEGNLNSVLQGLVISAFNGYTAHNYHSFVGGVSPNPPLSPGCQRMNAIYFLAKCIDFAVDDPFLTFSNLASPTDPRSLPNSCSAGATMITTGYIDVAENTNLAHAAFDSLDPFNTTYLNRAFIGGSNCNQPPIPTGLIIKYEPKLVAGTGKVTIDTPNVVTYQEHYCSNPSCYYNHSASQCQP